MRRLLLVKYGEIGLKGKNRPLFERTLVGNLSRAVDGLKVRIMRGRLAVDLPPGAGESYSLRLAAAAAKVFGVVGVTIASHVRSDIETICREAARAAAEGAARAAAESAAGGGAAEAATTFKIEARRSDKAFRLTSPEVAAIVGRHVLDEVPGLAVDVHQPKLRISVEVREDGAYIYGWTVTGPGGLPVGVSGRAVALISGGLDSPVAVWMIMKRGVVCVPLHFWSFPFTGERAREKVVDLCAALRAWGPLPDLLVCPFTEIQTAIRDRCPEELRVIIMRRMMMRVAERVAAAQGGLAVVTGESLGQVASQTLESLAAIEAVMPLPVIRPLIGLDKEEIIQRARHIGTYELSTLPYEDCCTLFVPVHPRTRPSASEVERAEAGLEVRDLVERAVTATAAVGGAD